MRTILTPLAAVALVACAAQPAPLAPQAVSFDDGVRALQKADEAKATIAYYARLAAAKNPDGMLLGYDSAVREAVDDLRMRDFLGQTVVPFFADYQAMDAQDTVVPADFPSGRQGEIHYTYVVTRGNAVKPVVFALVRDNGHFRIATVSLNACMRGQKPADDGRCK